MKTVDEKYMPTSINEKFIHLQSYIRNERKKISGCQPKIYFEFLHEIMMSTQFYIFPPNCHIPLLFQ